jgi:hypothetical protein
MWAERITPRSQSRRCQLWVQAVLNQNNARHLSLPWGIRGVKPLRKLERLTVSQRRVEEALRLQHKERSQRGGFNPARVTVTSRRTAALDGRLLAAVRAWRQ